MEMLAMAILAILLGAAALYAQRQIPEFTQGRTKIMIARMVLILAGIGLGITGIAQIEGRLQQMLVFLIGFGLVHMPAAFILFIKGRRGAGKS